jgi:hypothetical protein
VGGLLVASLFIHNLLAGLVPVLSEASDYHVQKSAWVVEHAMADDLILTSYEPILIFYLTYHSQAQLLSSGSLSAEQIQDALGKCQGNAYALNTFFQPLESMQHRNPVLFDRMQETGRVFFPRFGKVVENEFGGLYGQKQREQINE